MRIQMHPADIIALNILMQEMQRVEGSVDAGMLKNGDVQISWVIDNDFITIQGKDITTK